jgi:hypothetical protein
MPIPLAAIPLGISLGKSLYGAIRGKRGGGQNTGEDRYRSMYDTALSGLGRRSEGFGNRFEDDLEGYDPEPAFAEATEANLSAFDDDFARGYSDKLGSMVGAGRTPSSSGFGLRDAQETIRQGQAERGRIRQQGAADLAGARMNMLGMRGSYASGQQSRYMDAITGRLNTVEGQRLADKASKRGMWGALAGGALSAAGSYFGGRGR